MASRETALWKGMMLFLSGALITVFGTLGYSYVFDQVLPARLFDYFAINCLMMSAGIFIICKHMGENIRSEKMRDMLTNISMDTMGIYYIHPMIIKTMAFGEDFLFAFPLLTIPLAIVINWGISLAIIGILRKTPIVNKVI